MDSSDEYYRAVRRLDLKPSKIKTVWIGPDGLQYNVPDPSGMTAAQRVDTIDRLKANLERGG
jgi:hypothetical protein